MTYCTHSTIDLRREARKTKPGHDVMAVDSVAVMFTCLYNMCDNILVEFNNSQAIQESQLAGDQVN